MAETAREDLEGRKGSNCSIKRTVVAVMEVLGCLGAHPLPHAHVMYPYLLSPNTHMHTYIHKGTSYALGGDSCHCKTENRMGDLTFLLNETRGNQRDISIHPCKDGGADYILAPAELAVQLISLLCSYLLQLHNGPSKRVG